MKEGKIMILIKIKDYFLQPFKQWKITLPIVALITLTIIALIHLVNLTTYSQTDVTFDASGSINVDFNVFYIENESFPNNPIPQELNFLMSFTDFIEVEPHFFAHFSEEIEVHYSYISTKRLIVRHRGLASGEVNPIIFEFIYPLSDISNELVAQELRLPHSDSDVEPYTLFPEQYLDIYLNFVDEYESVNRVTENHANFLVELQVEFIYELAVPDWDMNETIVAVYHLPLTTEVYSFIPSEDDPTFSHSFDLPVAQQQATMPVIVFFVIFFTLITYFLFKGIKNLQNKPNEFNQELSIIYRKYDSEIVESSEPLLALFSSSSSSYNFIKVRKFEALLNLAINSNEQIASYHNDEQAEFVVVKGNVVYYYEILKKQSKKLS